MPDRTNARARPMGWLAASTASRAARSASRRPVSASSRAAGLDGSKAGNGTSSARLCMSRAPYSPRVIHASIDRKTCSEFRNADTCRFDERHDVDLPYGAHHLDLADKPLTRLASRTSSLEGNSAARAASSARRKSLRITAFPKRATLKHVWMSVRTHVSRPPAEPPGDSRRTRADARA